MLTSAYDVWAHTPLLEVAETLHTQLLEVALTLYTHHC